MDDVTQTSPELFRLEFDQESDEPVKVGTLLLKDKTLARFRKAQAVRITAALYRIEDLHGVPRPCRNDALTLDWQQDSGDPTEVRYDEKNTYHIVDAGATHRDHRFDLLVAMASLDPVYRDTEFQVKVRIDSLPVPGRPEDAPTRHREFESDFIIEPNHSESDLAVSFIYPDKTAPRGNYVPETTLDFTSFRPITHNPTISSSAALTLTLSNTAKQFDDDTPQNLVKIKEIQLIRDEAEKTFVMKRVTRSDLTPVPIDGENTFELVPRSAQEGDRDLLVAVIIAQKGAPSKSFRTRTIEGELRIDYVRFDSERGKEVDGQRTIRFRFMVRPNYSHEIAAIDFGTSALCIAQHSTKNDTLDAVLGMKELWRRKVNKLLSLLGPREEADVLISSELYRLPGNQEWDIGIPKTFIDLIFGSPTRDVEEEFSPAYVPFLKSYISACQAEVHGFNGEKYSIYDLVAEAYRILYKHYLMEYHGSGYQSIVIAHPNSYQDGQIEFLRNIISRVLGDMNEESIGEDGLDILAISESDAVLYHYLRQRARYWRGHEMAPPNDEEYVLCFDMGGGTLDLSYRRVPFRKADKGNAVYAERGGDLLGMVSMAGAGNLLDERLVELIEEEMKNLATIHSDLVRRGDANEDDFHVFPCFEAEEEPKKRHDQMILLDGLHEAVRAAKERLAGLDDDLEIVLPSGGDAVEAFLYAHKPFLDAAKEEYGNGFPVEETETGGDLALRIPRKRLETYLDERFYRDHVDMPIEVALIGEDGTPPRVDTLIISGRGALFPGIPKRVLETVTRLTNGAAPHRVTFDDTNDSKTLVALGALSWGQDYYGGRSLFETPKMHGVVGVALFRPSTDEWEWLPVISGIDVTSAGRQLKRRLTAIDNPEDLQHLLVLQTSIRSPDLVMKLLLTLKQHVYDPSDRALPRELEATGYFRVLYRQENPKSHLGFLGDRIELAMRLIWPEDEEYDDDMRSQFRVVKVSLHAALEGVAQDDFGAKPVAAMKSLTPFQTWPACIFADQLGREADR